MRRLAESANGCLKSNVVPAVLVILHNVVIQAAEWLENAKPKDLRGQDVLKIIGLHLDAAKAFEVDRASKDEADWSEEDEARMDEIIKEIEARPYLEHPDLGLEDWEGSEEGSAEDRSEESEDEQD
jgi:hypothetical protein